MEWRLPTGWPDNNRPPIYKDFRKRLRMLLWLRCPHCHYCRTELTYEESTLDHVIPKSKGGKRNPDNVVLACKTCNNLKRSDTAEVLLRRLARMRGRQQK